MAHELKETRLPGVGTKFTFTTGYGSRVAVIQHLDGSRELYVFRHTDDEEPAAVLHLEDDEARQLGAVLGGAYERPKIVEELEMALGELAIEWVEVPAGSPAIGKTLAECAFRARTGITIIGNYLSFNAEGFQRAAAGIDVYKSTGNTIRGNVSHDN